MDNENNNQDEVYFENMNEETNMSEETSISEEIKEDLNGEPKDIKAIIVSEVISWSKAIVAALAIAFIVNNFIIVNAIVPTGSMEPTIITNDRIVAFRLSYIISNPQRFDIVVFERPDMDDLLIKRIVGMPGETIMVIDGGIYIDGYRLYEDEQFIKEEFGGVAGPFVIGEGQFFVLGDHRNNSDDSRRWADPFVDQNMILGRAIFKYFPGFGILR